MQKRVYILGAIFLFLSLFLISLTSASVNVTIPLSGSNFTTTTITCIYANNTGNGGITTPLSANTTFSQNATNSDVTITVTGFTINDTTVSATASASDLADGLSQQISCIVGNDTDTEGSWLNATLLNIYTNTPTCKFEVSSHQVEFLSPIGISTSQLSTVDALAVISHNWTLYSSPGSVSTSTASSAPSFSGSNFNKKGLYTLELLTSDNFQNTVACTNTTITVRSDGVTDTVLGIIEEEEKVSKVAIFVTLFITFIVMLSAGIYFFMLHKTK